MRKNVLVNLCFSALWLVMILASLVASFIESSPDIFGAIGLFGILLFLASADQIRKVLKLNREVLGVEASFGGKLGNGVLLVVGKAGKILSLAVTLLLGVLMGIMSVEEGLDWSTENSHQMVWSLALLFTICVKMALNKVGLLGIGANKNGFHNYMYNYGFVTIFPISLGINYLLAVIATDVYFLVMLAILNYFLILSAIYFKHESDETGMTRYTVASWVIFGLTILVNVIALFGSGTGKWLGTDYDFGYMLLCSGLLYPCIALILYVLLYFLTNKLLNKKNKSFSFFGFFLCPILALGLQVLVMYFWYIGLIAIAVVWGVLTLLGLFVEVFDGGVTTTSGSKATSTDCKDVDTIERQMESIKRKHNLTIERYYVEKSAFSLPVIHVKLASAFAYEEPKILEEIRDCLPNEVRIYY